MVKRKSQTTKATSKKAKQVVEEPVFFSVEKVQKLTSEVLESSRNYNHLVPLIDQLQHVQTSLKNTEDDEIESLGRLVVHSLFKIFQKLSQEGAMNTKKDEKQQMIAKWLQSKYDSYRAHLREVLVEKYAVELSLQLDVLEIYLNLVKVDSVPSTLYRELVESLLLSKNGDVLSDGTSNNFIVLEFLEKFQSYWDLQTFFVDELHVKLSEWKSEKSQDELVHIFANLFTIMRTPLMFTQEQEEMKEKDLWTEKKVPSSAYKPSFFKSNYQKMICTSLAYPLTASQYKSVLLVLHKRIIPYMTQPQRLMDFLTDSYDVEDDVVVPILALNSLYDLMKNYNLEYPDFYTKLYSLLTPDLLYTRYRSRFFRLCDLFLSSTHLSAQLVASFVKKLARLSLTATASGTVIVIPFIYNILKRHPSCMVMLHNTKSDEFNDTFNADEEDPLKSGAMGSSLWELETLMSHYHPNIATLAKIFGEPFRKPNYNMEDFLDWSYGSLLESEKTRKYKAPAALEYEEWERVFGEDGYAKGWSL